MNTSVLKNFDKKKVGFFRFKKSDDRYLITNEIGDYHFLTMQEFEKFVTGGLSEKNIVYQGLKDTGFIRDNLDFNHIISRWRRRNQFLWKSTSLHIVVVTMNCDHRCVYCQAKAKHACSKKYDMNIKTARKVTERIFECSSRSVTIEFQGGEPLLNFSAVREIVNKAKKLSVVTGKKVNFSLVTNLTTMNEQKLKFLMDNKVNICTSLDGPKKIHNFNRVYTKGDSYENTIKWIKKINERLKSNSVRIGKLVTVTKSALKYHKEIVDEYFNLGSGGIFLRYVTPIGLAGDVWDKVGYSPEEYVEFYEKALEYIVELNVKKRFFSETTALIFLTKILSDIDFSFMDMRSPCGAGIGQIAYYYNGDVYACDEARMLSEMGNVSFCIGNVYKNNFKDFMNSPATKCLVTASCLDVQTSCSWCVYKPYCGVCPVYNYLESNDLYGRMPRNLRCKIYKGILDVIFTKLRNPRYHKVFQSWVTQVERSQRSAHNSYTVKKAD